MENGKRPYNNGNEKKIAEISRRKSQVAKHGWLNFVAKTCSFGGFVIAWFSCHWECIQSALAIIHRSLYFATLQPYRMDLRPLLLAPAQLLMHTYFDAIVSHNPQHPFRSEIQSLFFGQITCFFDKGMHMFVRSTSYTSIHLAFWYYPPVHPSEYILFGLYVYMLLCSRSIAQMIWMKSKDARSNRFFWHVFRQGLWRRTISGKKIQTDQSRAKKLQSINIAA